MIAVSNNISFGLASALSLLYDVKVWDTATNNPFDMVEDLNPSHVIVDIQDCSSSLQKAMENRPFTKIIAQTREQECPIRTDLEFNYIYGLDIFKSREIPIAEFDRVVVGDFDTIKEKHRLLILEEVSKGNVTTFGNGWPHTNNRGLAEPYKVFANAKSVIYPYEEPSDELIEALLYCGRVSSVKEHKHCSQSHRTPQEQIAEEYSYVTFCDNMCDFFGLPEKSFTKKLEEQCQSA